MHPHTARRSRAALYRTVWRWHFIVGLCLLPFLILLAVTGGAYLFKPELDHWLFGSMDRVVARQSPLAERSAVIRQTEAATGGRVLQYTPAPAPDRSVRLLVRDANGRALTAFADPYDARFKGATGYGGVMQVVRKIHSLQRFGFWASCLVEAAAGWTIVLVGTGVFLWWPRGQVGGVVTVRGSRGERRFWRDLHAVTGALAGVVVLFLALTGMPWSMFWGDHVQRWATAAHLGMPAPPVPAAPEWELAATRPDLPHAPHSDHELNAAQLPWALAQAVQPSSQDPGTPPRVTIDGLSAILHRLAVPEMATITLPEGPRGAYVATWRPDRVEDTRVVYVDQYSGSVLGDIRYGDWGPAARAIEWGIAVHQGQQFGALNRYVMLLGCLAIGVLACSSITMWWKRRPAGSLGIPPAPASQSAGRSLAAFLLVTGALFPLVGATFLVAYAAGRVAHRMRASA